ncbi:hypothetical protein HYW94_00490 [Candidatus Uhrbacteria bacterium]|nr:hypothetical protein [Candidatus Uhrbacteria bacterium]
MPSSTTPTLHKITTGADTPTGQVLGTLGQDIYEKGSIVVYIGNIIAVVLGFLGVVMIGLIIYSGILWMTASGNDEKIKTAQGHLRRGPSRYLS